MALEMPVPEQDNSLSSKIVLNLYMDNNTLCSPHTQAFDLSILTLFFDIIYFLLKQSFTFI